MAIEGLHYNSESVVEANPDLSSDAVNVSVEALHQLGLAQDRDLVHESVAADFSRLADAGRDGELYVQIPRQVMTLGDMVRRLDDSPYSHSTSSPATEVWDLWSPGKESNSYSEAELSNLEILHKRADWPAHGRIAVYNSENPNEPLLHFLGLQYSSHDTAKTTQLAALREEKQAYELEYSDFNLEALNAAAVVMIALQRRIKGVPFRLRGFMRDASIRGKASGSGPFVGGVHTMGRRLVLRELDFYPSESEGIGLSVGSNQF